CSYPFGNDILRYLNEVPTLVPEIVSIPENDTNGTCDDNGFSLSTTASETLFDLRSVEDSSNLISQSILLPEKDGNVADLSQYDEILNNLSSNSGGNLISDQAINSLLDEIDFSIPPAASSPNFAKSDENGGAFVSVDEYENILFGSSEVDALLGSISVDTSNDNVLNMPEGGYDKENLDNGS
ncbi:10295_t:CDS:1, partial [Acaulospora colombiana]